MLGCRWVMEYEVCLFSW